MAIRTAIAALVAVAVVAVGSAEGNRTDLALAAGAATAVLDSGQGQEFRPVDPSRKVLRFDLRAAKRIEIVATWLQHRRNRVWMSVKAVTNAAKTGTLRVRKPKGWSGNHTRLVLRAPDKKGVFGCGFGRFRAGSWPDACWTPYSPTSPFNQALPADPRVEPESEALVARVLGFGRAGRLVAGVADSMEDYGHPTYYSQATDPVYRLHCYETSWGRCSIEGHKIRVPNAARPAGGGDGHMTIIDQDVGWEYDLYKVRSKSSGGGQLEIRWGGRTRIDGDGLRSGATAAQFGNLAGIVRAAELKRGRIDHALFLTVRCTSGRAVFPARGVGRACGAIGESTTNALPMGARLQLAMSREEIDALAVPRCKKTILNAMARYGMFVGDTGGNSWGIKLESGSTFTSFGHPDPLVAFARDNGWVAYEDVWIGEMHDDVNWNRLRVIDSCVTRRTC